MEIVLIALIGGLLGGVTGYASVRRDLDARRTSLVATAAFLAVAIGGVFVLYGAVAGLIAAVLAYKVTRSRIGTDKALLAAGSSYLAVVAGFAVLLYASLETM